MEGEEFYEDGLFNEKPTIFVTQLNLHQKTPVKMLHIFFLGHPWHSP